MQQQRRISSRVEFRLCYGLLRGRNLSNKRNFSDVGSYCCQISPGGIADLLMYSRTLLVYKPAESPLLLE